MPTHSRSPRDRVSHEWKEKKRNWGFNTGFWSTPKDFPCLHQQTRCFRRAGAFPVTTEGQAEGLSRVTVPSGMGFSSCPASVLAGSLR